jgi:hypothetical protein
MAEYMIDLYNKGELDRIDIIYTKMLNSITEELCVERLLPLKTHSFLKEKAAEIEADAEGIIQKKGKWERIGPNTFSGNIILWVCDEIVKMDESGLISYRGAYVSRLWRRGGG